MNIDRMHRQAPTRAPFSRMLRAAAGPCAASFIAGLILLAGLTGCDDRSSVAPSRATPHTAESSADNDDHPTTQALVEGPWKSLNLGALPITLKVPESWELNSYGSRIDPLIKLEGPTPHGRVSIEIAPMPQHSARLEHAAETTMEMEKQENPKFTLMADVRHVGPLIILDHRALEQFPASALSGSAHMLTGDAAPITWDIRIFSPTGRDEKYDVQLLTFLGMNRGLYEQDKDFLDKVFSTIKYNPMAGM